MADRFPLIANSSANQIQELAAGDGLDLTSSNIVGAVNVKATGIVTCANTTASTLDNDSEEPGRIIPVIPQPFL